MLARISFRVESLLTKISVRGDLRGPWIPIAKDPSILINEMLSSETCAENHAAIVLVRALY